MSNLREIGKGLQLYSGDFNDYYPTVRLPGGESRPMASLALLYDQYVSASRIFTCPSTEDDCRDLKPGQTFKPHGYEKCPGDERRCSYAYDDTRDPKTSSSVVVAGDAPPTMRRYYDRRDRSFWDFGCATKEAVPTESFSEKNSDNHCGHGQNVLLYGGDTVIWTNRPSNPLIPGDDIYTAADPAHPGASDSYMHQ